MSGWRTSTSAPPPADRWADLAVATVSRGRNYPEGWEPAFFEALDVEPDAAPVTYHRWRWDST